MHLMLNGWGETYPSAYPLRMVRKQETKLCSDIFSSVEFIS
jgi:hypothetical protein